MIPIWVIFFQLGWNVETAQPVILTRYDWVELLGLDDDPSYVGINSRRCGKLCLA